MDSQFEWCTHKNDKFDEPLTTHQTSNGQTLSPDQTAAPGCQSATDDLACKCNCDNSNDISPCHTIAQQSQVGVQTGQRKVKWQEQDCDQILDLFRKLDCEPFIVRTNQANQEASENWVDSNDTSEPRREERHEQDQRNHPLRWSVLNTAVPAEEPQKCRPHQEAEEENPSNRAQHDIQRSDSRAVVDQGNAKSEEDPANHIVSNSRRKDCDSDRCTKQIELGKNTAKHRKSRNTECCTNEKSVHTKTDRHNSFICPKLMIQSPCNAKTQSKRQQHSSQSHAQSDSPVFYEELHVYFQGDEEEEKD